MQEVAFDSAHTINVANGRSTHANLRNVAVVDERSTAVKSAKRMPGCTTDIGASLLRMRHGSSFFQHFASSSDGVKFET